MQRRHFLHRATALASGIALSGCASSTKNAQMSDSTIPEDGSPLSITVPPLAAIDARPDRIVTMNVCTRPFRALGPRIELERVGKKSIVHSYGHGGSGWSLSWGSAIETRKLVEGTGAQNIAVIGCGAIGLTAAIELQRSGYAVTIYAKERPPYVRSSYATGIWSPDSRIVSMAHAQPFADRWETMARSSYRKFQTLLGLTTMPVEWTHIYDLADKPFGSESHHGPEGEPEYPNFSGTLAKGLTPDPVMIPASENPFSAPYVRRHPLLMFNISAYSRLLLDEFHQNGGRIVTADFASKEDLLNLDQPTLVNATGYGARALLDDDSLTPVRGQTCKLIPQPEVNYGIWYWDKDVSVYPRRDGLLVQAQAYGDFGNELANVDPAESISAVERLADIIATMKTV